LSAEPYLSIDRLVKDFPSPDGGSFRAVDNVSLNLNRGEIFALLGPSGCGKSSLLRMLGGFDEPSSGRILLGGQDLVGLAPYQRPVNMMFQSYALFPHLTVWDNIAFGLRREGLPRTEVAQRVDAMLKLVQLAPLAQRKPHQLSGGSSSAWRWRAAWPSSHACCCWMSRWARSTRSCARPRRSSWSTSSSRSA